MVLNSDMVLTILIAKMGKCTFHFVPCKWIAMFSSLEIESCLFSCFCASHSAFISASNCLKFCRLIWLRINDTKHTSQQITLTPNRVFGNQEYTISISCCFLTNVQTERPLRFFTCCKHVLWIIDCHLVASRM